MAKASREQLVELMWAAVDTLNALQPPDKQLEKNLDAKLFGRDGAIDSLALVQLISEFEAQLEDRLGVTVTLADERAISQHKSPFRTPGSLVDYAVALVSEAEEG